MLRYITVDVAVPIATYGFLRRAALALAVATLVPAPAHAQSPDDDEAMRICERKEWRTKGCQALKESMVRAAKAESEAVQAKAETDQIKRVAAMADQVYSYLVDKGALRPDHKKEKVQYDAGRIGQIAVTLAVEAAKFPADSGLRRFSALILAAYKQKVDRKFAPPIP